MSWEFIVNVQLRWFITVQYPIVLSNCSEWNMPMDYSYSLFLLCLMFSLMSAFWFIKLIIHSSHYYYTNRICPYLVHNWCEDFTVLPRDNVWNSIVWLLFLLYTFWHCPCRPMQISHHWRKCSKTILGVFPHLMP